MLGALTEGREVLDGRRAVALARHDREFEGLSNRQIADRLGRSPATVKTYFYDPTGENARAVKARYVGVCGQVHPGAEPPSSRQDDKQEARNYSP
ncbi:MAG: sigma factor-like helix-turn-helix DNA-binding protein [Solirubrobacteraceae bacterium]